MTTPPATVDPVKLAAPEDAAPEKLAADFLKARRRRSAAIAGALFLFVVLVFVITLTRMGGHALSGSP